MSDYSLIINRMSIKNVPGGMEYDGDQSIAVSINGGEDLVVKPGDLIACGPGDSVLVLGSIPNPSEPTK